MSTPVSTHVLCIFVGICAMLSWMAPSASAQTTTLSTSELLASAKTKRPFDETRLERGREIAKGGAQSGGVQMKCMACHGLQGHGSGLVPRLAGMPYEYLATQLVNYANGTRANPIMVSIATQLTPDEAADVIAYYASLELPDTEPDADLDWDKARAGEVLVYAGRQMAEDGGQEVTACIMCHNPVGKLDERPIAPPLEGQPAEYIEAQLTAWKNDMRGGGPFNVMSRIAKALTEEEVDAVAAYYASRNPAADQWP